MKILIVDGCPRKSNTWKLTLLAMEEIRRLCPDTEFEEITLSKLNLPFCTGCSNCFRLGPEKCPHYSIVGEVVRKIEQADGIIICSTCVGCRETTLLKNLFDHWCYMMHRPYFYKSKALIITSAGGKGQAETAQSIETSLLAVGFNRCYQAAFAAISWNAYVPNEKAKRRMGKITRRFLQDVQSGILHSPKYSLILVYNIMRGMGQHYAEGSRYPTADGTWWTDPCRNHSIYFPEVKLPFYKKWFGIIFFYLGKWMGGMKKMEVSYRK